MKNEGVREAGKCSKVVYRTVAIDVCLFFYEAVVFSATYFRFLTYLLLGV
jgi:hypothetical protein